MMMVALRPLLGANAATSFPTTLPVADTTSLAGSQTECYTGTLPTQIGLLVEVTDVQFGHNNGCTAFDGPIPTELGQLSAVAELWIFDQSISGAIPSELGTLTALAGILRLECNSITGTIPTELGRLTAIDHSTYFQFNSITGTIPTELGSLAAMATGLCLQENSISGAIPTELGQLSAISNSVYLLSNWISGNIPSEIGSLTELTYLVMLDANSISGAIPSELGRITEAVTVGLSGNWLVGAVPTEIGRLTHAWNIPLGENRFTGTIPTEMGRIKSLFLSVDLSDNSIVGTIPTQLGDLSTFEYGLLLDHNSITGEIPTELGCLAALSMYLQHNSITSTIPTQLGRLTHMNSRLLLEDNRLCGQIPTELAALSYGYSIARNGAECLESSRTVEHSSGMALKEWLWLTIGLVLAALSVFGLVTLYRRHTKGLKSDGASTESDISDSPLLDADHTGIEFRGAQSVEHIDPSSVASSRSSPSPNVGRNEDPFRHLLVLGKMWRGSSKQLMVLDDQLRVVLWSKGMRTAAFGWAPTLGANVDTFPFASIEDKASCLSELQVVLVEESAEADHDPIYALEAALDCATNVPVHLVASTTTAAPQRRVALGMAAVRMKPFVLGSFPEGPREQDQGQCHLLVLGQETVHPDLVSLWTGNGRGGVSAESTISDLTTSTASQC